MLCSCCCLGWTEEIIRLNGTAGLDLDPLHHVAAWHSLAGEVPMDRLSADPNALRKSGDRDIPLSEVLPELHPAMFTRAVNPVNPGRFTILAVV
jgi:hypothetical protein